MPTAHLQLVTQTPDPTPAMPPKLGDILVETTNLNPGDLAKALALQAREDTRLGSILFGQGLITERQLLNALALQWSAKIVDLDEERPDPDLMKGLGAEFCLKNNLVPWLQSGGMTVIATAEPQKFSDLTSALPSRFGTPVMAIAPVRVIHRHISLIQHEYLSAKADRLCPSDFSCRTWARPIRRPILLIVTGLIGLLCYLLPVAAAWVAVIWVFLNLAATSLMRLIALGVQIKSRFQKKHANPVAPPKISSIAKLPVVSVLVPLHREEKILPKLIERLKKSDYPKELLDVVLVLEAKDKKTKTAIEAINLPRWMRTVEVPRSKLQTKPRAMNYALDFCFGSLIGIYDAEDAPEIDQIHRIVDHFRYA